ncbi:MAG TPA: hypothetical protein VGG64_18475 [Pirellulales bacterium]|jgi:hypothetical protein
MSPALSLPIGRSISVRTFDILVRACVATFEVSAAVAALVRVDDLGPITLATRPTRAATARFAPRARRGLIVRAASA